MWSTGIHDSMLCGHKWTTFQEGFYILLKFKKRSGDHPGDIIVSEHHYITWCHSLSVITSHWCHSLSIIDVLVLTSGWVSCCPPQEPCGGLSDPRIVYTCHIVYMDTPPHFSPSPPASPRQGTQELEENRVLVNLTDSNLELATLCSGKYTLGLHG